jgi:hypothetical protein
MSVYYNIWRLKNAESIELGKSELFIDFDKVDKQSPVVNDVELKKARDINSYFWVSGGGTYLINKRYLVVVNRGAKTMVNTGKYSLFTGRGDSLGEALEPVLVIRELFEELLLYHYDTLQCPSCDPYQQIIDDVYSGFGKTTKVGLDKAKRLGLSLIKDFDKPVRIKHEGKVHDFELNYHVSSSNDINVIFLFSVEIELSGVSAADGEYLGGLEQQTGESRQVFLYDIVSSEAINITRGRGDGSTGKIHIKDDQMTEHLSYLVNLLKKRINNGI